MASIANVNNEHRQIREREGSAGHGGGGGTDEGSGIKASAAAAKQPTNKLFKIPTYDSRHAKAAVYFRAFNGCGKPPG